MLNIPKWDAQCENVYGFYWYYRPLAVTASGVGVTPVNDNRNEPSLLKQLVKI